MSVTRKSKSSNREAALKCPVTYRSVYRYVKALFTEVRSKAPAVLFLDEVDALLRTPGDDALGSVLRTVQGTLKLYWSDLMASKDKVMIVGATNNPSQISLVDFGRRFQERIYIDVPGSDARRLMLKAGLACFEIVVDQVQMDGLVASTAGFTGHDVSAAYQKAEDIQFLKARRASHWRKVRPSLDY